jgi:ketosteroid isomerase-like protein
MSANVRSIDAGEIVQRQLDAYNSRDIDAFMAMWADDAQYFEHPSKLLASGAAEIRARHVIRFNEPNLFGRLVYGGWKQGGRSGNRDAHVSVGATLRVVRFNTLMPSRSSSARTVWLSECVNIICVNQ